MVDKIMQSVGDYPAVSKPVAAQPAKTSSYTPVWSYPGAIGRGPSASDLAAFTTLNGGVGSPAANPMDSTPARKVYNDSLLGNGATRSFAPMTTDANLSPYLSVPKASLTPSASIMPSGSFDPVRPSSPVGYGNYYNTVDVSTPNQINMTGSGINAFSPLARMGLDGSLSGFSPAPDPAGVGGGQPSVSAVPAQAAPSAVVPQAQPVVAAQAVQAAAVRARTNSGGGNGYVSGPNPSYGMTGSVANYLSSQNVSPGNYQGHSGYGSPYTPSGYKPANYNPASGGSVYSYKYNSNTGQGSYVNSYGQTINYNSSD
jgi:hypothetical protein